MVSDDWESMTIDELFALREEVAAILKEKLMAKNKMRNGCDNSINHPNRAVASIARRSRLRFCP